MGLFDIFNSKTVESSYKTLLCLFQRTHKSFTLTKNEKCIVEFTLQGLEPNTLLYGTIEQYFDAEKVNGGNFIYDPSKRVTISLHTSYEGQVIHVEKSFHQSEDQTTIYNIIVKAYLEKAQEAVLGNINKEETTASILSVEEYDNPQKQKEEQSEEYTPFIYNIKFSDFLKGKEDNLYIKEFVNSYTGDIISTCVVTDDWDIKVYLRLLDSMSLPDIVKNIDNLFVGITECGNYWLHDGREIQYYEGVY